MPQHQRTTKMMTLMTSRRMRSWSNIARITTVGRASCLWWHRMLWICLVHWNCYRLHRNWKIHYFHATSRGRWGDRAWCVDALTLIFPMAAVNAEEVICVFRCYLLRICLVTGEPERWSWTRLAIKMSFRAWKKRYSCIFSPKDICSIFRSYVTISYHEYVVLLGR